MWKSKKITRVYGQGDVKAVVKTSGLCDEFECCPVVTLEVSGSKTVLTPKDVKDLRTVLCAVIALIGE